MRKFKNNVSDGWLFKQELRLWRNFARNWDKDVDDCDFFDIFDDAAIVSKEESKAVITKSFPPRRAGEDRRRPDSPRRQGIPAG